MTSLISLNSFLSYNHFLTSKKLLSSTIRLTILDVFRSSPFSILIIWDKYMIQWSCEVEISMLFYPSGVVKSPACITFLARPIPPVSHHLMAEIPGADCPILLNRQCPVCSGLSGRRKLYQECTAWLFSRHLLL